MRVTSLVVDAIDATVALAPRDLSAALDDEVGARGSLATRADALVDAIAATRSREDALAASEAAQHRKKTIQRLVSWRRSEWKASDAVAHLEQRDQVVDVLDLVVGDENFGVHELAELALLVVDEVRAHITSVDGQALRELHFVI